tara:strand:+ start:80 stop:325 length:246 start_codon:yes stop_codon:yes gene_type:complete
MIRYMVTGSVPQMGEVAHKVITHFIKAANDDMARGRFKRVHGRAVKITACMDPKQMKAAELAQMEAAAQEKQLKKGGGHAA